jgi:hypothetical protein
VVVAPVEASMSSMAAETSRAPWAEAAAAVVRAVARVLEANPA